MSTLSTSSVNLENLVCLRADKGTLFELKCSAPSPVFRIDSESFGNEIPVLFCYSTLDGSAPVYSMVFIYLRSFCSKLMPCRDAELLEFLRACTEYISYFLLIFLIFTLSSMPPLIGEYYPIPGVSTPRKLFMLFLKTLEFSIL